MDFIYSACNKCGMRIGAHGMQESIACGLIDAPPKKKFIIRKTKIETPAPPATIQTTQMAEEWRKAVSTTHPELVKDIEVSSLGKVRNTTTGRLYKGTKDGGKMTITRETIGLRVCHLVAETFIATREDKAGQVVKHKDDDQTNNAVSNLEYVQHIGHNGLSLGQKKNLMAKIEKTKTEIKERQELLKEMEERLAKYTTTV